MPEQGTGRVRWLGPDNTEYYQASYTIDLHTHPRLRQRTRLNGLPIAGAGVYNWEISYRIAPDDDWDVRAQTPVEISFVAPPPEAGGNP